VSKNSPTSGFITGGAVIGKTYKADYLTGTAVTLFLEKTDFSLADNIIKSLNTKYGKDTASTADGKSLLVTIPAKFTGKQAQLMAELGELEVEGSPVAGIVLDERTGTIIMGAGIKIDEVAISHGNIHVAVASRNIISQPSSFSSGGETVQTIDSTLTVKEDKAKFATVKNNATLEDLVKSLTSLGATADDIIAIITDMKVAGAIKGNIMLR
jgi:flagellar P-ring protein precursor FlgI